jgi:hypothetical protein
MSPIPISLIHNVRSELLPILQSLKDRIWHIQMHHRFRNRLAHLQEDFEKALLDGLDFLVSLVWGLAKGLATPQHRDESTKTTRHALDLYRII